MNRFAPNSPTDSPVPLADLSRVPHWLGVTALITLFHLREKEHCSSELSDLVGVSPASMTGTIDNLHRKGLVTRQRNPNDRRKIIVAATERGLDLTTEVFGDFNAESSDPSSHFSHPIRPIAELTTV